MRAIEWSCDRWRHVTLKGQTRDLNSLKAQSRKLLELETSNLVCSFVWGMPIGRTKISPQSGRGLSHVTPEIFGIWSNISPKLLELETSNLVHGFVWRMTSRRTKISPKSGRGLGHVTPTIFGSTVGYPSDSLASCWFSWQSTDKFSVSCTYVYHSSLLSLNISLVSRLSDHYCVIFS